MNLSHTEAYWMFNEDFVSRNQIDLGNHSAFYECRCVIQIKCLMLPDGVADTGASPYPTAGAGQAGVGAGPVPLTEGCRPRDPGLAMAGGGTPGERPGPARGAEVCTFT